MSTRSNIIVKDAYNAIQLYRHWDGYPEGVIPDLADALAYAWQLPRFEADDFAAAIVRAWKAEGGGNISIDGSPKAFELVHGDTEWVYVIRFDKQIGEPVIAVYDWHEHWLEKSDTTGKTFSPQPWKTIKLSEAKEYTHA